MDSETRGGRRKPPFWTQWELSVIELRNVATYLYSARGRWSFLQWMRSGRGRL
jgi:hypothetical protein